MLSKPSVSVPRQRLSRAAITSLICGLVFIPIIAGLAALVAGFLAIRATRDPAVLGRRWAIIGIILGALNLVIWADVANGYIPTIPIRNAVRQYIDDLDNNRLDAAVRESVPGRRLDILGNIAEIRGWGTFDDVEVPDVNRWNANGVLSASASGFIGFTGNSIVYVFRINLVNNNGSWKVSYFDAHR